MEKYWRKTYLLAVAMLTWLAVSLQLYLILLNRTASITDTIVKFFSFSTILTNLLVAITVTTFLLNKESRLFRFLSRPQMITAIAVYISVVGIVYNLILRQLWSPQGMQRVVDETLHLVNPLLFFIYWMVFVNKTDLKWRDSVLWLIYPFIYLVYILVRGELSGQYPYPFVDVVALGFNKVLLNCFLMLILFLITSFLFIGAGRFSARLPTQKI